MLWNSVLIPEGSTISLSLSGFMSLNLIRSLKDDFVVIGGEQNPSWEGRVKSETRQGEKKGKGKRKEDVWGAFSKILSCL